MEMKIGILVGMEKTFPAKLIEKINARQAGVTAEYLKVGGVGITDGNDYRLIFDRISHEIPFYRSYLKHAALNGTIVVNNPFWWSADEKFFGYSLAAKLGLAVPKTVLLPQKSYKSGVTDASLRNLEYPLKWDEIIEHVGLPAILKPHDGGGWRDVYKVNSMEELWAAYDGTHTLAMVLQEFIDFEEYVRCYCVGRKHVLVMPYDPHNRRYLPRQASTLTQDLEDRIIRDTILINEALGYDLNTVEFAMRDGIPYAIDFTNPAPDADIFSVTEPYFEWITDRVTDLLIDYALHGEATAKYHRWSKWINHEVRAVALTEVIDQIIEPVKPKFSKKTGKGKKAGKGVDSASTKESKDRKKDGGKKEKGHSKDGGKDSKDGGKRKGERAKKGD
jgi:glutathione synthase/RimK-type ligase-like ATP-grasp enzyme